MTLLYFYRGHSAAAPKYVPSSVPERKNKRKKLSRRELRVDPKDLIPEARIGKEPSWHSKRMFFGDPDAAPPKQAEVQKDTLERPRPKIDLVALKKESSSILNRLFKVAPDLPVAPEPGEPQTTSIPVTDRLKAYYGITLTDNEISALQENQRRNELEIEARRVEEERLLLEQRQNEEEEEARLLDEYLRREEEEEEDRRRKLITIALLED